MVAPMSERMRDFMSERDRVDLWDSMLVVASTRQTAADVESWLLHCADVWSFRQGSKVDRPANRECLDWVIIEAHRRAPQEFRAGCAKAVAVMADKQGKPQKRYRDTSEPRPVVAVLARDVATRDDVAPAVAALAPMSAALAPLEAQLGADYLCTSPVPVPESALPERAVRLVLYDDDGY